MKKSINVIITLVIIIIALYVGYSWIKSNGLLNAPLALNTPALPSISPTASATPQASPANNNNNTTNQASVAAQYPTVQNVADPNVQTDLNQAIKNKIDAMISSFNSDVKQNALPNFAQKSSLNISYETSLLDNNVASFKITNFEYVAGMAHPSTVINGFNYNLKTNKQIVLTDLFNPGSDFYPALSQICRDDLKNQLTKMDYYNKDMVEQGTDPKKPANFSEFVIGQNSFTIIFNQALVAPYVAGTMEVKIPYSQLAEFNNNSELVKTLLNP